MALCVWQNAKTQMTVGSHQFGVRQFHMNDTNTMNSCGYDVCMETNTTFTITAWRYAFGDMTQPYAFLATSHCDTPEQAEQLAASMPKKLKAQAVHRNLPNDESHYVVITGSFWGNKKRTGVAQLNLLKETFNCKMMSLGDNNYSSIEHLEENLK
jgi:hypothetical protein